MRTLIKHTVATNSARVPCRSGEKIRILGVHGSLTPALDGEVAEINFIRGTVEFRSTSGPVLSTTNAYALAIGLGLSKPHRTGFVVATGASQFTSDYVLATGPLPDVWFDDEVTVQATLTTGAVTDMTILYEVMTAKRA